MTTNWNIDRRHFLRGAVGALVPLPFLNVMENAVAKNLAGEVEAPLRFMTLFKPNGAHPPSWNINGGSEFDFRMSPLMAPFAKHRDDLIILDNMGDFGFPPTRTPLDVSSQVAVTTRRRPPSISLSPTRSEAKRRLVLSSSPPKVSSPIRSGAAIFPTIKKATQSPGKAIRN